MKKIIILITLLFALLITISCKREKAVKINTSTHQKADLLDHLSRRLDSLSDTSLIDPKRLPDIVTYSTAKNGPTISEQRAFIKASGFSVVDEPVVTPPNSKQRMLLVTESFDQADAKYKSYISKQSNSRILTVFKQNTASLIIKRYLLGNESENSHLQYYTEELLQNHSQNYGLLYLAIQQLKGYISTKRLQQYKNMIHTDPVVASWNKQMEVVQHGLKNKSGSLTEHQLKLLNVLIKGSEMAKIRAAYLVNKIIQI